MKPQRSCATTVRIPVALVTLATTLIALAASHANTGFTADARLLGSVGPDSPAQDVRNTCSISVQPPKVLVPGGTIRFDWSITPGATHPDDVDVYFQPYRHPGPRVDGPRGQLTGSWTYTAPSTGTPDPAPLQDGMYLAQEDYYADGIVAPPRSDCSQLFFYARCVGKLRITVYDDANNNRQRDPGEAGIPDVPIRVRYPALYGNYLRPPTHEPPMRTGSNGSVMIAMPDLPAVAGYTVIETDIDPPWKSTTPNDVNVALPCSGTADVMFGDWIPWTPTPTTLTPTPDTPTPVTPTPVTPTPVTPTPVTPTPVTPTPETGPSPETTCPPDWPPASVVLVLDKSGSMDRDDGRGVKKFYAAVDSAIEFVNNLHAEDQVALVSFSHVVDVDDALTSNYSQVIADLVRLKLSYRKQDHWGTHMGPALNAAHTLLTGQDLGPPRTKVVVLLTDGIPCNYAGSPGECRSTDEAIQLTRDAADRLRRSGIAVFGIGLGTDVREELMRDITRDSAGAVHYWPVQSTARLPEAFRQIAVGLCGWTAFSPSGVAASSQLPGWPAELLIDGWPVSNWSSNGHGDRLGMAEWAAVGFRAGQVVDAVRLWPRVDARTGLALGYPQDLIVQYSRNGDGLTCDPGQPAFSQLGNWRPLLTLNGQSQPSQQPTLLSFAAAQAECLRVFGTTLSQDDYGNQFLQLAEIEVLGNNTVVPLAWSAASSTLSGWPADRLIDGNHATSWSSRVHSEHLKDAEWVALILGASPRPITALRLWPGQDDPVVGFPEAYVVQFADNSPGYSCDPADPLFTQPQNWKPLVSRFGVARPDPGPIELSFSQQSAACLRVLATDLSPDGEGRRFFQLGEMEVSAGGQPIAAAQVLASSEDGGLAATRTVDGNVATVWRSRPQTQHLSSAEWAAVVLPAPEMVEAVRLWPRTNLLNPTGSLGFPKDFVVQYSNSGGQTTCDVTSPHFKDPGNWSPLAVEYAVPQPPGLPVLVKPATATAMQCVRILAVDLSQDDYGNRYLQLGELELLKR